MVRCVQLPPGKLKFCSCGESLEEEIAFGDLYDDELGCGAKVCGKTELLDMHEHSSPLFTFFLSGPASIAWC